VLIVTFLCRLVVVGPNGQDGVSPDLLREPRQVDGATRIVAAAANDDLGTLVRKLHAEFTHTEVFVVLKSGSLSRCAARNNGIHTAGNLKLDESLQMLFVHFAFAIKGSHQSRHRATKQGSGSHRIVSLIHHLAMDAVHSAPPSKSSSTCSNV